MPVVKFGLLLVFDFYFRTTVGLHVHTLLPFLQAWPILQY